MITYVFPPAAWVGGHRTLKYCKYLGRHGWTPIVLTAKPIGVTFKDPNLLRQIPPDVKVYRTFDVDPAKFEARLAARKYKHRRPNSSGDRLRSTGHESSGNDAGDKRDGLTRLKDLVKALFKESPDSHIFWVPFAFMRGVVILLSQKVDVIYCSSPPHSSHLIAFMLGKFFRKPFIIDFRDSWYVNGSARIPGNKLPVLLGWETRLKGAIVREAARVISVSKGERDELAEEFPDLDAAHFTHITNGFDSDDLQASVPSAKRSAKLNLIHAGTIYPGIAGEFFEALHRIVETDSAIAQSIQVHLLGEITHEYEEAARRLEAAGIVTNHGLQPHASTLRMVHQSDVLVILMGGTQFLSSHVPSKFYEYLHAGKPILAIAQEGDLTDMARKSGLGIIVPPSSVDSVVQALRALAVDHSAGRLVRDKNEQFIRSFDRSALTERLAAVLNTVWEEKHVDR